MGKIDMGSGTLLSPVPAVMVSVGDTEKSNIITVAWTGIVCSDPAKTYISVRPSRYSWGIIKEKGEFVINLTSAKLVKAADFCGIYTGAKVNKFERCGLTAAPSRLVSAPSIAESPVSIECRVSDVISLGSHDMFIADILNVSADESLLDENGKLHFERASLAAYSHGEYFALGRSLGTFGFSARKKRSSTGARPGGKNK